MRSSRGDRRDVGPPFSCEALSSSPSVGRFACSAFALLPTVDFEIPGVRLLEPDIINHTKKDKIKLQLNSGFILIGISLNIDYK